MRGVLPGGEVLVLALGALLVAVVVVVFLRRVRLSGSMGILGVSGVSDGGTVGALSVGGVWGDWRSVSVTRAGAVPAGVSGTSDTLSTDCCRVVFSPPRGLMDVACD